MAIHPANVRSERRIEAARRTVHVGTCPDCGAEFDAKQWGGDAALAMRCPMRCCQEHIAAADVADLARALREASAA